MPRKTGRTYDDIVRQTVLDPDTSVRPTREQEEAARRGLRAQDPDERALQQKVQHAIIEAGFPGVTCEVTGDLVTLRGHVPSIGRLHLLEDTVAAVPGVETVYNQVVVAAH